MKRNYLRTSLPAFLAAVFWVGSFLIQPIAIFAGSG